MVAAVAVAAGKAVAVAAAVVAAVELQVKLKATPDWGFHLTCSKQGLDSSVATEK